MKGLMAAASLLLVAAALGVAVAGGKPKPRNDLQAAKAASARYHSFQQALKHGYTIAGEACISRQVYLDPGHRRWGSTRSTQP